METPTTRYQLRPLDLGEMLDLALRIYLQHWRPLLALTLGIVVPVAIPTTMLRTAAEPNSPEWAFGQLAAMMLELVVVSGLLTAVLVIAVSEIYLHGATSPRSAIRRGAGRIVGVLVVALLVGLVTGFGYLLCLVPGLYWSGGLFASQCALILEGRGIGEAISRSWELTKGDRWRAFGCFFVFQLIAGTAAGLLGAGFGFVGQMAGLPDFVPLFCAQATSSFFVPFPAIATVLLYYDYRVRREAFDVQMLARELGGEQPASP